MDDLGAVAHRGSMGAMPISSTTNEKTTTNPNPLAVVMHGSGYGRPRVALPTGAAWSQLGKNKPNYHHWTGGAPFCRGGGLSESTHPKNTGIYR